MSKNSQKDKLIREQNNLCYWCEQPMGDGPGSSKNPSGPTIDHLDDKCSPIRGQSSGLRRRVVACYKCNNGRAKQTEFAHHGNLYFAIQRILMSRERLKRKLDKAEPQSEDSIKFSQRIHGINYTLKELSRVTGENHFE